MPKKSQINEYSDCCVVDNEQDICVSSNFHNEYDYGHNSNMLRASSLVIITRPCNMAVV